MFFFLREVAVKRMDEGVVQEWNSWVWAAETDRIEELIFHTDGAAQLTKAWPRRVSSAGWVSSCLGSHMMALSQTFLGSSVCSLHVGGSVFDLRAICTSS